MKPINNEQALSRAARLCAQSEKAPKEIFEKLITWGLSTSQSEEIVNKLIEENYIDERRFAHAFVHDKFEYEHWGKIKIAYSLRLKGIGEELISNTIDELINDDLYLESAKNLISHKMRALPHPLTDNDKAKVYRFAAQRGYESSVISKALRLITDI